MIKIGQILEGGKAVYRIIRLLSKSQEGPWLAMDSNEARVVVKTAPLPLLKKEAHILLQYQGHEFIRRLVDQIQRPPSIVLEYMDDTVQNLLKQGMLSRSEAKRALRSSLQGLMRLHEDNVVHTDVKPDNVLVRYTDTGPTQYKLGDLGDSTRADVPSNNGHHIIGPPVFRAPEVSLGIPWTTKADIWTFGAMGITMLTGRYVIKPKGISLKNEREFAWGVLQVQNNYFRPFREKVFSGLVDESAMPSIVQLEANYRPFPLASPALPTIGHGDGAFFDYIMKVDARERPTARQVLQHPWFDEP